tara:strand:- start:1159 stop:1314 length:156 start_codon:yes stop_codon:yes gene_type:complete
MSDRAAEIVKNNPEWALLLIKRVLLEKEIDEKQDELWDVKKKIKEMIDDNV